MLQQTDTGQQQTVTSVPGSQGAVNVLAGSQMLKKTGKLFFKERPRNVSQNLTCLSCIHKMMKKCRK